MSDNLPQAPRSTAITRAQQGIFLTTLAQCGNVAASARAAGFSRASAYRLRLASPQFSDLWDAALVQAIPFVEQVLADRALNGVEEVVYYHGEEVATRRRYDGRLLLAHLGRLDRMSKNTFYNTAIECFEPELREFLDTEEPPFVDAIEGA